MRLFHSAQSRPRKAFTLGELIIVIGLIAVLIAIGAPIASKVYRNSGRARLKADLATIGTALEAYKLDHRDYPRTPGTVPINGSILLCWALIAPGPATSPDPSIVSDGADGPGFRTRGTSGQVYGPYIQVERFKLINVSSSMGGSILSDNSMAIADRYGNAIYYCPQNRGVPSGAPIFDVGPSPLPMYDYRYFLTSDTAKNTDPSQLVLPLADGQAILGTSTATPYLLWSAGPNGAYGHDPATNLTNLVSDDVTNFRP